MSLDATSPAASRRGPAPRLLARAVAVLGAAALTTTLLGVSPARAAQDVDYVALGDSFTSGPGIQPVADAACQRSAVNYPHLVAEDLGVASFTDMSCGGAVIDDLRTPQHSGTTAQFDALTPETDLVTVGIGGNDFGFIEVLTTCAALSLSDPRNNPCEDHYGDELHQRVEELRPRLAEVYAEIGERSPNAEVYVVGYLHLFSDWACWPAVPIAYGDTPYLSGVQTALNAMIAEEAERAGATYVDVYERGHGMCDLSRNRWVEGVFATNGVAPVHPNARGMSATADRVVAATGAVPAV
ncbi:SGNH/GDSL hydrolase family protein [Marinactinospora thermotolerans]|uniref:GDSL-like Lipase/Acylhydrolase family protein n=1 Tax=Marinactinospora thermotolerans DSM 45154 TaxID=1122192 RepID=A0A1T4KGN4_9ACTN|nr:SGNH/GDSL hydrolase family protein [Marinactinospora thermotolerans]SJZ41517.1 GDSL-like Lipase/Acylhydrolase family protein [Marinactinospora thermotolerans DSM 45154]